MRVGEIGGYLKVGLGGAGCLQGVAQKDSGTEDRFPIPMSGLSRSKQRLGFVMCYDSARRRYSGYGCPL